MSYYTTTIKEDFRLGLCSNCKMYLNEKGEVTSFVEPSNVCDATTAKVVVILSGPSKVDSIFGTFMAKQAKDFLLNSLSGYASSEDIYIDSIVRCYKYKPAKSPEAKRCYSLYLQRKITQMQAVNPSAKVILFDFYPAKIILGYDLKETLGKCVVKDGVTYAVLHSPAYYIAKNVRWFKNDAGKLVSNPDGFENAYREWARDANPTLSNLFGVSVNLSESVITGESFDFPYTVVSDPTEMINRLTAHKDKWLTYDLEDAPTEAAVARGHTGLDWFYGRETCQITSAAYGFFNTMAETGYAPGKKSLTYDPDKMVIYSGPLIRPIVKRMSETKLIAFNASFDTGVLYAHTNVLADIGADPCDMAYVVEQGRKKYNLESLVTQWVPEFATYAGDIKKNKNFNLPTKILRNYNAGDSFCTAVLFFKLKEELTARGMDFLYWSILANAKPVLRDMEARGVMVDKSNLDALTPVLELEMSTALTTLRSQPKVVTYVQNLPVKKTKVPVEPEFNPNSSTQVLAVVKSIHGDNIKSADKKSLDSVQDSRYDSGLPSCEFISSLIGYRKAKKKHSTYAHGLALKTHNGIVYPSFRLNTTETGRTSSGGGDAVGLGKSNQINIQNIPRDKALRALFRARPDHYLAYADYSQIEIRVAGAYAKSKEIRDVCLSDKDFHGMTTSIAYNVPYDEVMAEDKLVKEAGGTSLRTKGKVTAFGVLYGMNAVTLAVMLKLFKIDGSPDVELAQEFIDNYFKGMPSVKAFIDSTHKFVIDNFYIRTVFDRIRVFDHARASTLREAVNTLVQSAASDIFLMALSTTGNVLKSKGLYNTVVHPWAEVHDAITWEVHNSVPPEEIESVMRDCMITRVRRDYPKVDRFLADIPLDVDFKVLQNWA